METIEKYEVVKNCTPAHHFGMNFSWGACRRSGRVEVDLQKRTHVFVFLGVQVCSLAQVI